jgi:glutaredoxin 3
MTVPILYVKRGCPYCSAAIHALDERGLKYEKVEVRRNPAAMQTLQAISGQTKTPTLVWGEQVLADFGVEQLDSFLARVAPKS